MSLNIILLLLGLALLPLAIVFARAGHQPELVARLPRWRLPGVPLAVLALSWSAWDGYQLFKNDFPLLAQAYYITPAVIVVACLWLDFLFIRALGGMMILLAVEILQSAFDRQLPCRGALAAGAYGTAAVGMLLLGRPWVLRDLLARAVQSKSVALGAAALLSLLLLLMLVPGLLG